MDSKRETPATKSTTADTTDTTDTTLSTTGVRDEGATSHSAMPNTKRTMEAVHRPAGDCHRAIKPTTPAGEMRPKIPTQTAIIETTTTTRNATMFTSTVSSGSIPDHRYSVKSISVHACDMQHLVISYGYLVECRATRLPSVSSNCAMKPYSPIPIFGRRVLPWFALIFAKVTSISSTDRYTTVPSCEGV